MSASQRRKGAEGERSVCALLSDTFGTIVKRRLGQARDGQHDADLPPFRLEIKRRKRRGPIYDWVEQCETGAKAGEMPTVFLRADGEQWLVVMRFADWAKIAREEIAK